MRALIVLLLVAGTAEASSHCHETSPILGRRHCGGFGQRWAHQPWMGLFGYELSLVLEKVGTPAFDAHGSVFSPTTTAAYHAMLGPGARSSIYALGPRQRFGYRDRYLSVALEVTFGFDLAAPPLVTQLDGFAPIASSSGSMFDVAGVVGVHTRVDPLRLGAEIAVGVRDIVESSTLPDGFTACPNGATGKGCGFAVNDTQLLVELRGRADWWVNPSFTIGLVAGYDIAARGESLALAFAFHGSPFDGL